MVNNSKERLMVEISRLSENSVKLKEETSRLKSNVDKLQQLIEEINSCWQGEAKQLFVDSISDDYVSLNKVVIYLEKISEDFNYALNTYIQCENSVYDAVSAIKL